jgi:hypothetical protein
VKPFANTLYRAALFWAKAPPDTAAYVCAVLGRPDLISDLALWAANAVAGEIFTSLLILIFALYLWPKLPARARRFLLSARDRFSPGVHGAEDGSRDGDDNTREVAELREELRLQRAQIRSMHRRMDRMDRELEEARRPWWRRLLGR